MWNFDKTNWEYQVHVSFKARGWGYMVKINLLFVLMTLLK